MEYDKDRKKTKRGPKLMKHPLLENGFILGDLRNMS
jgi:hypothetical protein